MGRRKQTGKKQAGKKQVKATQNKAKETETSKEIQRLWATFGELSAEQEILSIKLQQLRTQRAQIFTQINKLRQEKSNDK